MVSISDELKREGGSSNDGSTEFHAVAVTAQRRTDLSFADTDRTTLSEVRRVVPRLVGAQTKDLRSSMRRGRELPHPRRLRLSQL